MEVLDIGVALSWAAFWALMLIIFLRFRQGGWHLRQDALVHTLKPIVAFKAGLGLSGLLRRSGFGFVFIRQA